jgi:hypothetical protein
MEILNTFAKIFILLLIILNTIRLVKLFLKVHKIIDISLKKISNNNKELIPNDDKLILFKYANYIVIEVLLIIFYFIIVLY